MVSEGFLIALVAGAFLIFFFEDGNGLGKDLQVVKRQGCFTGKD